MRTEFSIDEFLSLAEHELGDYMIPFLHDPDAEILSDRCSIPDRVLDDLGPGHLVYALELLMVRDPRGAAPRVADFLAHEDAAVCLAAFRCIKMLPVRDWPRILIEKILAMPVVRLSSIHYRTGETVDMGTSEQFLQELRAIVDAFQGDA